MGLPRQSIEKLFRDHFPNNEGLHVPRAERESLIAELQSRFQGSEWSEGQDLYRYGRGAAESNRRLCSFILDSPIHGYGNEFEFELDARNRLLIRSYTNLERAPVASLDQIDSFLFDCRQRIERQQNLRTRRKKVGAFRQSAIEAQLKKMSREEEIDFVLSFTPRMVKLQVELSQNNMIHIHFSPKKSGEILPRLSELIRMFKNAYALGLTFKVKPWQGLIWGEKWVCNGEFEE